MGDVQCQSQRLELEYIINDLNIDNSNEDTNIIISATIHALEKKYQWNINKLQSVSKLDSKYAQYRGLKYSEIGEEVLNNFINDVKKIVC